MTVVHYIASEEPGVGGHDPEKRRQVLAGAREVFLARGFDAASMGDIARAAGVSKGTLYVYFGSKQDLFAALVHEECAQTAERTLVLGTGDGDLRAELITAGRSYIEAMIRPEHIATVRIVIAVGEKFPEISKAFLKAGLEAGVQRLSVLAGSQDRARRARDRGSRAGGVAIPDRLPCADRHAHIVRRRAGAARPVRRPCGGAHGRRSSCAPSRRRI